jgi:hypothetical protein
VGDAKEAAASSAAFIVLNSISGLLGRAFGGTLDFGSLGFLRIPAGMIGGMLGSHLGARYLPGSRVQQLLAAVLLLVVARNVLV